MKDNPTSYVVFVDKTYFRFIMDEEAPDAKILNGKRWVSADKWLHKNYSTKVYVSVYLEYGSTDFWGPMEYCILNSDTFEYIVKKLNTKKP